MAARESLRYTPAGIPILSFQLIHQSGQLEAGVPRLVELQIEAIAVGRTAQDMDQVAAGQTVKLEGFLTNRSKRSQRIVLHVNEFKLI